MYLFSPYATPKLNSILFSPAIFLTSRKNISPLGSPNLFARRQAFAAIRRRTQRIKRKKNEKESENGADAPANKEYANKHPTGRRQKSREQGKFEDIRLHMAKIVTYYRNIPFHIKDLHRKN